MDEVALSWVGGDRPWKNGEMGHVSLCSSALLGHDGGDRTIVHVKEMGVVH